MNKRVYFFKVSRHHFQYAFHITCFTDVDSGFILANACLPVTFFCMTFSMLQFSFSVDVLCVKLENQLNCV